MGEEANRVANQSRGETAQDLRRLESEIAQSRRRLDQYVDELDRRRHRLLSPRRNPAGALGAALGAAALLGGAALIVRKRRSRVARARRKSTDFREALGRMMSHPERVATDGRTAWASVLAAVAPVLVQKLFDTALAANGSSRRRPRRA